MVRRLSSVWCFALGGIGFFLPFYSLYLSESAGLRGTQVGAVTACIPLMGAFAPGIWGQLADRTGRRRVVLALVALGTALGNLVLLQQGEFWGFVIATAFLALFSSAIVPMSMSVSLALLRESTGHILGRVRVWGTLGFAACVLSFPLLVEAHRSLRGIEATGPEDVRGLALMFPCAAVVIGVGGLLALRLPKAGAIELSSHRGEWRQLLRSPAYLRLIAFAFLCYLSLQGPLFLFPILVRGQGGGIEAISRMWALMLLVEVPMVALFGAIASRIGVRGVIGMGMAAAALRWSISGWTDDLRWLTAAQLLHGVTVSGVMLGLPVYVDSIVPERLRSTAQGLLTMLGLSCASIVSSLASGWLVERLGPMAPARVGGLLAAGVLLTLPVLLRRPRV